MKSQARLAVGVGIGYLLGRTRKMRLALMIAAAGATGAVGSPRQLVQRGLKQLGTSPELSKLTEATRGQLLTAAKTAAVTAASSRIDALNERLQGTAEDESHTGGGTDDDEPAKRRRKGTGRGKETAAESEQDRAGDDTAEPDEEQPEEESGEEPARPRKRKASAATTRRRARADSSDDEPHRTGSRSRSTRTPVRRARR